MLRRTPHHIEDKYINMSESSCCGCGCDCVTKERKKGKKERKHEYRKERRREGKKEVGSRMHAVTCKLLLHVR